MNDTNETLLGIVLNVAHDLKNLLGNAAAELVATQTTLEGPNLRVARRFRKHLERLDDMRQICVEMLHTTLDRRDVVRARQGNASDPLNVLWVDDDDLHLASLRGLVEDAGWHITGAVSVGEALSLAAGRHFDAAILDLIMPPGSFSMEETAGGTLTGLALARRIREHHYGLPIVFLTISNDAKVSEWCRENPPGVVLPKPDLTRDSIRKAEAFIRSGSDRSLDAFELMLGRFPAFVAALGRRHADRPAFQVSDEYDVQDLLRAFLTLTIDDVREEEWSPSYAGGSSRIDFVLPQEKLAVEVKMTRPGLTVRHLGEQLLVDVARYKSHPDLKALLCFIVDTEGVIANRVGFVRDLIKLSTSEFDVRVVIVELGRSLRDGRPDQRMEPTRRRSRRRAAHS